jgi:hypothetical protein
VEWAHRQPMLWQEVMPLVHASSVQCLSSRHGSIGWPDQVMSARNVVMALATASAAP